MTEYTAIQISLRAGEDELLRIFLASDGNIKRIGDATTKGNRNSASGTQKENLYANLVYEIPEGFEEYWDKVFDIPEKKGKTAELEIVQYGRENIRGMKFIYGTDSTGPPAPVINFVKTAIAITDPWYTKQLPPPEPPPKKWWQILKK